jgi:long-chain acyl-CoA synthetase
LPEIVKKSVYLIALSVLCTGIGGLADPGLASVAAKRGGSARRRDGAGTAGEVARAVCAFLSARLDGGPCDIASQGAAPAGPPVARGLADPCYRRHNSGMTTMEWQGTPADVVAERASILAEVGDSTLLSVYAETADANGDSEAHRWEAGGEWQSLTYREVRERVRDAALGLAAAGFQPGEFAVIWSRNRSEATIADYAVMHARGVPVFLYNTLAPEQAAYITGHCEATVAIVEGAEYLAKLLSVRDQLPRLRRIVLIEGAAEGVMTWADLLAAGREAAERDPGAFDATWRQVRSGDLATLIYTSGTTGQPKGVMITHHNARSYQVSVDRVLPAERRSDPDGMQRVISYLPMAHVTGRSVDHWAPMAMQVTIAYCPDQLKVFEVAALTRPTIFFGIPRVWEKLHTAIRVGLAQLAMPDATSQTVAPLPDEIKQAILARPGLDACLLASSGSAPLDPEIIAFFRALGLPLTEGWGMTELSNAATISAPDRARVGTVGTVMPGMEARIADDGEVLIRGPLVMSGYYKDPERTAETLDADGWLHTGDIGVLDSDGYLRITDRKKELIITSGGKNISPALIEYHLQRHPLIGQACAIGDRRNYVTALLVLDAEAVRAWTTEQGITLADMADAAKSPEVLAEVERAVAQANSHLARVEQVRRHVVLPGEWTSDSGELTPTQKKRRRVITERYADEIDLLYR